VDKWNENEDHKSKSDRVGEMMASMAWLGCGVELKGFGRRD
jgi:hypothetical protein